jgi:diguanylate cyclase (GGDEF)-like protein
MLRKLSDFFERRSKRTVGFIAILFSILLGALDLKTSVEIHFLLLYLIPIFLGSWFVSREMGVYLAFFGSLVWFVADTLNGRAYSSAWITYWNLLMRTSVFILFAVTQAQLRAKIDELSNLAARDFLTGLPNGRAFYQLAAKEMDRAFGLEPMTLACIDVTGLQWVNDRAGYPAGDQILCTIAHTIQQHAPRPDLVGRSAGTSFLVLLPNTTSEAASPLLEQLRNALQEMRRKYSHPLIFHISAIAYAKAPRQIAQLIHQAESQMTRMKGEKKDSIQIAKVDELPLLN